MARGPEGPTSFSHPRLPPFASLSAPAYAGPRVFSPFLPSFRCVLCCLIYYYFPTPGPSLCSPARPGPQPVRPNSVLQPCPFGGPVLLFSAAAAQLTLSSAELLRTMGVCRSMTTCNFIQGRWFCTRGGILLSFAPSIAPRSSLLRDDALSSSSIHSFIHSFKLRFILATGLLGIRHGTPLPISSCNNHTT